MVVSALAFDLGASSGRAVVGRLDGDHLTITDTHRFPNDPVSLHTHLYWDILRQFHEIKQGLRATRLQGHTELSSLGIDAWGVDFGLLDANGELLGNPYHYRDAQNLGIMEEVWQQVPHADIFAATGLQFLPFNTLYQLSALQKARSPLLSQAKHLLMIPELLRSFLTGEIHSEWSIASTTQMCDPYTHTWHTTLLTNLSPPERWLVGSFPPSAPRLAFHKFRSSPSPSTIPPPPSSPSPPTSPILPISAVAPGLSSAPNSQRPSSIKKL